MTDYTSAISKIRRFYIQRHRIPSYRELQYLLNYKSVSGAQHLANKLVEHKVLAKDDSGKLVPNILFTPLPLVGSIKAGFPAPAEDQIPEVLSFDQYLVNYPEGSFLLKVSGDSMIDAGIHDGDIIVVEKHRTPKSGDIVIAYVDGGWTLKRFVLTEDDALLFFPENKKYDVITPKYEAVIGGVVVSSARKYY